MTSLSTVPIIRPKASVDLSLAETQALMDFEIFSVARGLKLYLLCIPCRRRHDEFFILGATNDDLTEWRVDCACTDRIFRGTGLKSPALPPAVHAREPLEDGTAREEVWPRHDWLTVKTFEQLLDSLKLQYQWRCIRCELAGEMMNGVTGAHERSEWIAQCKCTKRVYRGSDAVQVTH